MHLNDIRENINHITQDSKKVKPGSLFVSMNDQHLLEAIKNGANAIISKENRDLTVPVYKDNPDKAYENLLKDFYDISINLIGITGTDGKTTTASIIQHLLTRDKCGNIGTNGISYKQENIKSKLTTPILEDTYMYLDLFQKQNMKYAVMEVSSEGILDNRIASLEYDKCIFTNLTHEHLNTHQTMENYFNTKIRLFNQLKPNGTAIINIDDEYSNKMINNLNKKIITFGTSNEADYQITNINQYKDHTTFTLKTNFTSYNLQTNLMGKYNLYNITAAIIAVSDYISIEEAIDKISSIPQIEGRYVHLTNNEIDLIIDFAHTPNALKNLLETVNINKVNNSILVMGSAGEKDKTKRKTMGNIASTKSDFVIFTSEDPKTEDETSIIDHLLEEVMSENYVKIYDRKEAIKTAIAIARVNDTVIITGKGNEHTFNKNNILTKHNDIEIAKEFLAKKRL